MKQDIEEIIKQGRIDKCWKDLTSQSTFGVSKEEAFWLNDILRNEEIKQVYEQTQKEISGYDILSENTSYRAETIDVNGQGSFVPKLNVTESRRKNKHLYSGKRRSPKQYDPTLKRKFVRTEDQVYAAARDIVKGHSKPDDYLLVNGAANFRQLMLTAEKKGNSMDSDLALNWLKGYIDLRKQEVAKPLRNVGSKNGSLQRRPFGKGYANAKLESQDDLFEKRLPAGTVKPQPIEAVSSYNGVFGHSCRI